MTYQYHEGAIWRGSRDGWVFTDRAEAERILRQYTQSADQPDYFQRRARELRDEMAEAIRQYDEQFNLKRVA